VPYLIREFPRISSAKAYAFSAGPRDTCIGKGKARAPYEFGCKSLPLRKQKCRWQPRPPSPKGGQFVLHAKALRALEKHFADLLALAMRVRFQDHRQRARIVYALYAPEVECTATPSTATLWGR
jgi:hypothetical protein